MTYEVDFHPAASEEVEATKRWYLERSAAVAQRFDDELTSVVGQIADAPLMWPERTLGVRQRPMRVFPFLVIYRIKGNEVHVVAVGHGRRMPGYWRHRLAGI